MRRKVIAAAWIGGATVPLFLATVFIVGCCVFPFHRVMHKLMPICDFAASIMRGDDHGQSHHAHDEAPATPAREKHEPVKRIATEMPETPRLAGAVFAERLTAPDAATAYRSYISLGAIRCDCDVGLYGLVETFRI